MLRTIARRLRQGSPGHVYNIGGNSETTNLPIVHRLCDLVDEYLFEDTALREAFPTSPASKGGLSAELIAHVCDRPGHDRRYAINYANAQREMGYAPGRDLACGLRGTLDWYLSNADWWKPLLGLDRMDGQELRSMKDEAQCRRRLRGTKPD
jgi:dTDP-glucose 4,6-dehydratase